MCSLLLTNEGNVLSVSNLNYIEQKFLQLMLEINNDDQQCCTLGTWSTGHRYDSNSQIWGIGVSATIGLCKMNYISVT